MTGHIRARASWVVEAQTSFLVQPEKSQEMPILPRHPERERSTNQNPGRKSPGKYDQHQIERFVV
jgi:hypothetical protein